MDFISGLLGGVIRVIYNLVGNNYLVALLIFTFLTKLLLFPLMLKQLKSTAAIQKIAPEDKKLREKYKDNPQKLNEEILKLYSDNKVSPMAGCLIPLIQLPIIIAMFYVVQQPLKYVAQIDSSEIKTYAQEYLGREEVSDQEVKSLEITLAKEYDLLDMDITENINLGDAPKDAFSKDEAKRVSKWTLLVPVLSLLFSILSNKVSQRKQKAQMTEDQAEMQKSMNLMMPILSAYIAYAWPIALGIYWLFGSILSIVQQLIMDKLMEEKNDDSDKKEKKNKVLFLGKGENND